MRKEGDEETIMPCLGVLGLIEHTVSSADTAKTLGSGELEVLGTPKVLALVEEASVVAIASQLKAEETTVGIHVDIQHKRATAVGRTVIAEAECVSIEGTRATFSVRLREADTVLANGTVTRAIVDREAFLARIS